MIANEQEIEADGATAPTVAMKTEIVTPEDIENIDMEAIEKEVANIDWNALAPVYRSLFKMLGADDKFFNKEEFFSHADVRELNSIVFGNGEPCGDASELMDWYEQNSN
jgi:hypothetical protein